MPIEVRTPVLVGGKPFITTERKIKVLKSAAFIIECVAHMQGRERELLGTADALREIIKEMES